MVTEFEVANMNMGNEYMKKKLPIYIQLDMLTLKIFAFWFDSRFQKKRTNWTVKYLKSMYKERTVLQFFFQDRQLQLWNSLGRHKFCNIENTASDRWYTWAKNWYEILSNRQQYDPRKETISLNQTSGPAHNKFL